jgi:hypothetical protein
MVTLSSDDQRAASPSVPVTSHNTGGKNARLSRDASEMMAFLSDCHPQAQAAIPSGQLRSGEPQQQAAPSSAAALRQR